MTNFPPDQTPSVPSSTSMRKNGWKMDMTKKMRKSPRPSPSPARVSCSCCKGLEWETERKLGTAQSNTLSCGQKMMSISLYFTGKRESSPGVCLQGLDDVPNFPHSATWPYVNVFIILLIDYVTTYYVAQPAVVAHPFCTILLRLL